MKNDERNSIPECRQTVSGIDKLNYQLVIDIEDYTTFYRNVVLTDRLENDSDLEFITENKQYKIFRFERYLSNEGVRPLNLPGGLGFIKFKNLNRKDGLESIYIEISSALLQLFTIEECHSIFVDKINSYGLKVVDTKISRVDLNSYVYGFNFDWITDSYFSTNAKHTNEIKSNRVLETFYLGSRGQNAVFLRIYNKWKELKESEHLNDFTRIFKKDIIKAKFKMKDTVIEEDIPLWNIEYEIRREKLKSYKINTIEDLVLKANSLFLDLSTKNRLLVKKTQKGDTNRSKIKTHPIWDYMTHNYNLNNQEKIEMNMIPQKKYIKDEIYMINRINETIEECKNIPSKRFFIELMEKTKSDILKLLKADL